MSGKKMDRILFVHPERCLGLRQSGPGHNEHAGTAKTDQSNDVASQ
jgi:hypothetical protein